MPKSLRTLVLVATVCLTAAPALHADVMGTDPRPRPSVAASPSLAQAVLSFFGF